MTETKANKQDKKEAGDEEEEEEEEEEEAFIQFHDSDDGTGVGIVIEEDGGENDDGVAAGAQVGVDEEDGEGGDKVEEDGGLLRPYTDVPWHRKGGLVTVTTGGGAGQKPITSTIKTDPTSLPPLLRLHNELLDFCDLLAPTKAELEARQRVTKIASNTVKALWPDFDVQVFGSEATKVFLPESDIDMVVLPPQELPVHQVRNNLFQLAEAFKQEESVTGMEVIAKARVPIIKLRFLNLQVDISFSSDSGLKSARYMLERMEALPPLRPLILVFKYFLAQRELNETFTGGCGSFLLQLMLIAYLQHAQKEAEEASGSERTLNLGSLFLGVLRFYGHQLNYEEVGLSVLGDGILFRKLERGMFSYDRPWVLAVENPLDSTLDVGKNSYNMPLLKAALAEAYTRLHNVLVSPPAGKPISLLAVVIRPDQVLSGRPMPKRHIFQTRVFTPRKPYRPQVSSNDNYHSSASGSFGGIGGIGGGGGAGGGREVRMVSTNDYGGRGRGGGSGGGGGEEGGKKRGRWSGGRREDQPAPDFQARGDYNFNKRGRR